MSGRHSSEWRGRSATITPFCWLPGRHDAVAGNQCRQVAAPVAAEYLACLLAIQRFDFNQYAKMGDDQAALLLAEVAALQFLQGAGLTLGGADAAFFLDFFDAPALPATELAFGHGGSAG